MTHFCPSDTSLQKCVTTQREPLLFSSPWIHHFAKCVTWKNASLDKMCRLDKSISLKKLNRVNDNESHLMVHSLFRSFGDKKIGESRINIIVRELSNLNIWISLNKKADFRFKQNTSGWNEQKGKFKWPFKKLPQEARCVRWAFLDAEGRPWHCRKPPFSVLDQSVLNIHFLKNSNI